MSSLLQLHSLSGKLFVPLFILSQNNVIVDCCLLGACYFQVLLCSGFAWVLEKLGKSWHFILTFSKTGKSWEKTTSPGNLLYSSNKVFTICALRIVCRPVGELILNSWDRKGLRLSPRKLI